MGLKKKPFFYSDYNRPCIVDIYKSLNSIKRDNRIVLDLDNSDQWGPNWSYLWSTMVGVENYSKRLGNDNLFCINENWQILFTKDAKCSAHEIKTNERFTAKVYPGEENISPELEVGKIMFYKVKK